MKITLPDNSTRDLPEGSSGYDLAIDIGPGLAKSAVAVVVNGKQTDLFDEIVGDSNVEIITIESQAGIEIMRHTLTAQVLAKALRFVMMFCLSSSLSSTTSSGYIVIAQHVLTCSSI